MQEKTVLIIKPDGVKKGIIGEIISRIEKGGLKIVALQMLQATREKIDGHYPKDEAWIKRLGEKSTKSHQEHGQDVKKELGTDDLLEIGKMVRGWLIDFMVSGPIVKMIIQGDDAIKKVREISGPTMPSKAGSGTIRGDFSDDDAAKANREKRAVHNLVHASETPEEAKHELEYWFAPEEIHDTII
ncbi:MAG: nucleoside-diphosphate kinase [Candidatus Nealsonbacteria bacterium]|nr:MAG: nucleoside-diphosphate kinase [Candidatus Nealsonbacteria bacterium]